MTKTNRGRTIDMEALMKSNEHTIAVTGGGQSMNARGDLIGVGGKIIKRVEQREKELENFVRPDAQKVKLSDLRKFSGMIDDKPQQQNQLQKLKQDAQRMAKKVEIATASLANNGQPIIKDYSDQDGTEELDKPKKPKRVIRDSEE